MLDCCTQIFFKNCQSCFALGRMQFSETLQQALSTFVHGLTGFYFSLCFFVSRSLCLSHLSISFSQSLSLSICRCIGLSIYPSIGRCMYVYIYAYIYIYLSEPTYLYLHPYLYLSIYLEPKCGL